MHLNTDLQSIILVVRIVCSNASSETGHVSLASYNVHGYHPQDVPLSDG